MTNSLEKTDISELTKDVATNKRVQGQLQKKYHKEERNNTYLVGEDEDLRWDLNKVLNFDFLWNEGHSLQDIANYFKRDIDEVAYLVIDRAKKGKIKPRKNGIFGNLGEVM